MIVRPAPIRRLTSKPRGRPAFWLSTPAKAEAPEGPKGERK